MDLFQNQFTFQIMYIHSINILILAEKVDPIIKYNQGKVRF